MNPGGWSMEFKAENLGDAFLKLGFPWFRECYPEGLDLRSRQSVFNDAMTMWMMIAQRGIAENSLVSAVQQLKQTTPIDRIAELIVGSKKLRFQEISNNPSGFCHARQRVPIEKAESFFDYISAGAEREHRDISVTYGYYCVVLDGSEITLQNDERIKIDFPPHKNQHGPCPPRARVVVAHNVVTGAAYRPEIGSVNEGEQTLVLPLLQRLPKKSLAIADRNFGVFSVAWAASQANIVSLVRLQEMRAAKIVGKAALNHDTEYNVTWTPSRHDRETNEFASNAQVPGRVVAITLNVPGRRAERFFFFTTAMDLTGEQILEIYKKRWFIETDLRSIKETVKLDTVKSKIPDVVRKEILFGVLAYTLIRTVIARGAKMLKLEPREISFSRARQFLTTVAIVLSKATNAKDVQLAANMFLPGLRQLKLQKRSQHRTEPRVIATRKRKKFPPLKGTREQARQKLIKQKLTGS
jgi:hypothetical protein